MQTKETSASSGEFFRVAPDADSNVCAHCKKGAFVTVVYTDETGEEVGVGISWEADGDGHDNAEQHANELNWAYGLGFRNGSEKPTDPAIALLRRFLNWHGWLEREGHDEGSKEELAEIVEEAERLAPRSVSSSPSAPLASDQGAKR